MAKDKNKFPQRIKTEVTVSALTEIVRASRPGWDIVEGVLVKGDKVHRTVTGKVVKLSPRNNKIPTCQSNGVLKEIARCTP